MKLVVTGSRFGHADVEYWLDRWVRKYGVPTLVILGDAKGVDTQAREWAIKHDYFYHVCEADWDVLGKKAGPLRNQQMVDLADVGDWCIAFPAAESKGTFDCIQRANRRGLMVYIPRDKVDING